MNVVHVHEIVMTSDRGRSKSWLKNGKNGRLKISQKSRKSDESDKNSTYMWNERMRWSEWNTGNEGEQVTASKQSGRMKWVVKREMYEIITGKNDT